MPHDRDIRQRLMSGHTNGAASAPNPASPRDPYAEKLDAFPELPAAPPPLPIINIVKSPSDAPDAGLRSLDHCTLHSVVWFSRLPWPGVLRPAWRERGYWIASNDGLS